MQSKKMMIGAMFVLFGAGCLGAPESAEAIPEVQSDDALGETIGVADNRYTYDFSKTSLNVLNGYWGLNGSTRAQERVHISGSRDSALLSVAVPCAPGLPTPGGNPVNGLVVSAGLFLNCVLSDGVGSVVLSLQRTDDKLATAYCSANQFRFRVSGPVRDASGIGSTHKFLGWGCLYAATYPTERRASMMTLAFIDSGGNRKEAFYKFVGR